MFRRALKSGLVTSAIVLAMLATTPHAGAITIDRTPVQGAGLVTVANGLPLILGAPVGTLLEVDIVFTDMQHIELLPGTNTNIEFGIGNTGNPNELAYRIVFDLTDEFGNRITNEHLVVESTAPDNVFHIPNQPQLILLPEVTFHGIRITVETAGDIGTDFDLFVAGGAGDPGTGVSGPIVFNRAVVGVWTPSTPEPITAALGLMGLATLGMATRRRVA